MEGPGPRAGAGGACGAIAGRPCGASGVAAPRASMAWDGHGLRCFRRPAASVRRPVIKVSTHVDLACEPSRERAPSRISAHAAQQGPGREDRRPANASSKPLLLQGFRARVRRPVVLCPGLVAQRVPGCAVAHVSRRVRLLHPFHSCNPTSARCRWRMQHLIQGTMPS